MALGFVGRFDDAQELTFNECRALEEAGAVACTQHRIEIKGGATTMSELRDFKVEADNKWLSLRIQRIFVGSNNTRAANTTLRLDGYALSGADADEVGTDQTLSFTRAGQPAITVFVPGDAQIDAMVWDPAGTLAIHCSAAPSYDFRVLLMADPPQVSANDLAALARFQDQPIELDMDNGSAGELSVPGCGAVETVHAVRILNPVDGPYWVREDGWWHVRGAQMSRHQRATDLLKLILVAGRETQILPYGFLDGVVKNAWGCQYTQLMRDIETVGSGVRLTVRAVDINPKIWAPRVRFTRCIASARVDGEDWRYFEGSTLFLANHRRDYHVEVLCDRFAPRPAKWLPALQGSPSPGNTTS